MYLGGCDKIEEKIAGVVFRAAPGAYLLTPCQSETVLAAAEKARNTEQRPSRKHGLGEH